MTGPAAALLSGLLAGAAVLLGPPGRSAATVRLGQAVRPRGRPVGARWRLPWSPAGTRAGDRADRVVLPADLVLELVAGLLDAGAPARQAVRLVGEVLDGTADPERVLEAVELSESSGLPPAALLRARADDLRRERDAAHGRAVNRLGVLLVLPMGLCLLPAFVLLGVVPVVLDLFRGP